MMTVPLLLAALALAPRPDADAGVEAFAEGRYEDAAEILERAYAADPQPPLLFAWAQAERYAGHCTKAVPLYREYLEGGPPAAVQELARAAIEACGEDPEGTAEPEPVEEPEPEPEVTPEPEPPPPPRRAARDPWGHALTWPGVALTGVGVGLLSEAHRRRAAGDRASTEQAYRDTLEGAPALSRAGIAVLAGGGALLVAGLVRFAVVAKRDRKERAASALRLEGAGLVWKFELAPQRGRALR